MIICSVLKNFKVIYISQGNIPSKWAHTFQAIKMTEALAGKVRSLRLLTSRSIENH